jgi:transketolase
MQDKNGLDLTCINTMRTLAMDAVQAANSGHPGTPMAMAPVAYCLWQQFLRYDPEDPVWPTGTASSSRPVTPRCSCTRSCT